MAFVCDGKLQCPPSSHPIYLEILPFSHSDKGFSPLGLIKNIFDNMIKIKRGFKQIFILYFKNNYYIYN